jgi:hypothetical protein
MYLQATSITGPAVSERVSHVLKQYCKSQDTYLSEQLVALLL